MTAADLVEALSAVSPRAHAIYIERVEPDGYVMEHPFMSDLTREMLDLFARYEASDPVAGSELIAIMDVLETRLVLGDAAEDNAIHVSCLEELPHRSTDVGYGIRELAGSHTRWRLEELEKLLGYE